MSAILNYILDQQDKPKEEKMILAFKPQFVQPILDGSKIHTIRIDFHDRWKEERAIQMATGVRTKDYKCFKEAVCSGVQYITMNALENNRLEVWIEGKELDFFLIDILARNDGFDGVLEFEKWFYPIVNDTPYYTQNFKIIHWTDKRY
jgi:hypothetical protein